MLEEAVCEDARREILIGGKSGHMQNQKRDFGLANIA